MDSSSDQKKQKTCTKHNQPFVFGNQDGLFCCACLQQLPDITPLEQLNQQEQAIFDEVIRQIDLDHQSFQELLDQLLKFKNTIISSLDKITQLILDHIKSIQESKSKMNCKIIIFSNKNPKSMITEILLVSNQQQQIDRDVINQITPQLKSIQLKYAEIEKFYPFLDEIEAKQQMSRMKIQEFKVEKVKQFKRFEYQLINESTEKYVNDCYSLAFNKDNTILVVGLDKTIIVYEFINEKNLKEMQRLSKHTDYVSCLYFMKQSNSFASGSHDKSIIIWNLDQNNKWIDLYELKEGWYDFYTCISMNKMENQIISGNCNCSFKIWIKQNGNWKCSQNITTNLRVQNISLNEMEDKLIVCENNWEYEEINEGKSCVQIFMYKNNQQWSLAKTVYLSENGYRLSFTIGDQFVFATTNSDYLVVYDYDTGKNQLEKVSQIIIQNVKGCRSGFPCQYIQSQGILTYKHGQFLNIIKVNEQKNYELMQEIEFGLSILYGRMSDDGQYLATWDTVSSKIQIRKIKQLE